jgi:hypothetical protein
MPLRQNAQRIEQSDPPSSKNVVNFTHYKNRDIILLCDAVKAKAERGEVAGLFFAIKDRTGGRTLGTTGEYITSPNELLHLAGDAFAYYAKMFDPKDSGEDDS